jgi:hypothetical protein
MLSIYIYTDIMLSNSEIKKRLLGGAGTKEGAKKNKYMQYLKANKGIKDRPTYQEFKNPKPKKKKQKCIKTENVKIYSKNVTFDTPPEIQNAREVNTIPSNHVPSSAVPQAPPITPPITPAQQIRENVNRIPLKDVIAMNKKLREKEGLSTRDKIEIENRPDFMSSLADAIKNPKLKKAKERVLAEVEPEKKSLMDELKAKMQQRQADIEGAYQAPQPQEDDEFGEGLSGGYFYDDSHSCRSVENSNRLLELMNERNRYGFGY